MTHETQESAEQAVRDVFSEWGADLVLRVVAERTQEINEQFNLSPCERERVWSSLRGWFEHGSSEGSVCHSCDGTGTRF
jgi:hypothetical protein